MKRSIIGWVGWVCMASAAFAQEDGLRLLFDEKDLLISATESRRILGQAPAIATVITEKQIRDMGARTLIEVLQRVPGMLVSYPLDFATGHTLAVRGLKTSEAEKTLLMVNGHRVNNPYSGSWTFLFDEFPLQDVRRIEIIRGPGSALYGSNAVAAVIHIITKSAGNFHGNEADVAVGGWNLRQAHAALGGEGWFGSMHADTTDGDRAAIRDRFGVVAANNFWRRQRIGFFSAAKGGFSGQIWALDKTRGSILDGANAIDTQSRIHVRQVFASGLWRFADATDWDAEMRVDADWFTLDPHWQLTGTGIVRPKVQNLTLSAQGLIRYRGIKDQEWTIGLGMDHMRQFSVHTWQNGVDVSATRNHNRNAQRTAPVLLLQDEWSLGDWTVTLGARWEHFSDVGGTITPRLALVWRPADGWDFKALYGRSFRAPDWIELYSANNPSILGNPSARPETADTWEIGGGWSNGWMRLEVNAFDMRLRDMLIRQPPNPLTVNLGRATFWGAEAVLRLDVKKDAYGYLAYTWQRGKDRITGVPIGGVPMHIWSASGDTPLFGNLHLHADLLWQGRQRRTAGDTRAAVPAQWLANAALHWQVVRGLRASFVVRNIFDRRFLSPTGNAAVQDIPIFPRQWLAQLQFNW